MKRRVYVVTNRISFKVIRKLENLGFKVIIKI